MKEFRIVVCPVCGQYIAQQAVQMEAALFVHRFLKHEPPAVQGVVTLLLAVLGMWGLSKLAAKLG